MLTRILTEVGNDQPTQGSSFAVTNKKEIRSFIRNKDNPFLVSFPRTGSHWLRMIMELYFESPSLTRVFYYPEKREYLTLHTHDLDLSVVRSNVIYLYRDPVDTIYSQLSYHHEDIHDTQAIIYWSNLYGYHLNKWLHTETFTRKKTIISYERLRLNLGPEFEKVCQHFNLLCDPIRLETTSQKVSITQVKEKTEHDPQVVNLSPEYSDLRTIFRREHAAQIWDIVLQDRQYLADYF